MTEEVKTQTPKTSFWFGVTNPKWISIKVQYFFRFGGFAAVQPFIVLFYASLGLTTAQIAIFEFCNIIMGMISRPIFGVIADKTGRQCLVLGLGTFAYLIPTALLVLVPPAYETHLNPVVLTSNNYSKYVISTHNQDTAQLLLNLSTRQENVILYSAEYSSLQRTNCSFKITCFGLKSSTVPLYFGPEIEANCENCTSLAVLGLDLENETLPLECNLVDCSQENQSVYGFTFWMVGLLRGFSAIAAGPSISMVDSIAYDIIGPDHRSLWGQTRMFGTLGWGVAAGSIGALIDWFHSFTICFIAFTAFTIVAGLTAIFWLPQHLAHAHSAKSDEPKVAFGEALRSLSKLPVVVVNLIVAITSGMLFGVIQVVAPQLMKDLGASKLLFGICNLAICIFEIPSLFFAGAIIDRIGEIMCFLLMYLAYAARFFALMLFTHEYIWWWAPLQVLHILCFAIYIAAATRVAAAVSPPGTSTTVQAIAATCFIGIGAGSGILLSSLAYQKWGQYAFFYYGTFSLACFLILLIIHLVYLRKVIFKFETIKKSKAPESDKKKESEAIPDPEDPLLYEAENAL